MFPSLKTCLVITSAAVLLLSDSSFVFAQKDGESDSSPLSSLLKMLQSDPKERGGNDRQSFLSQLMSEGGFLNMFRGDSSNGRHGSRGFGHHSAGGLFGGNHASRSNSTQAGVFERIRGFLDETRNGRPDARGSEASGRRSFFGERRGDRGSVNHETSTAGDDSSQSSNGRLTAIPETLQGILGRSKRQAKDKSPTPSPSPKTIDELVDQIKKNLDQNPSSDNKDSKELKDYKDDNKDSKDSNKERNPVSGVADDIMSIIDAMTEKIEYKIRDRSRRFGRRHNDDNDEEEEEGQDHGHKHGRLRERLSRRYKRDRCPSSSSKDEKETEKNEGEQEGKDDRKEDAAESDNPTKKTKRHYDEWDYYGGDFGDYGGHYGGHYY